MAIDTNIVRSRGLTVGKDLSVQELRNLQKRLKAIEPGLRTQFMRDIKKIAVIPNEAIKSAIPATPPLSGMKGLTNVSWGVGKPAKSTSIIFRTRSSGSGLNTTLLRIRVNSVATAIADIAGRSGRSIGQGKRGSGMTAFVKRTRSGELIAVARRTPYAAGAEFVQNLNRRANNKPSRFAWKAVEKDLPALQARVSMVIKSYEKIANYRMVRG